MAKLRLRDPDYVLIADALDYLEAEHRNIINASLRAEDDLAEGSEQLAKLRGHHKVAQHCRNLAERIRKARTAK